MRFLAFLSASVLLVGVSFTAAQKEHASLAGVAEPSAYTQRFLRTADGLPEGTVQAFAQTPDRYLWIGTTGGLVRFDGVHFTVFDRDNTPAFTENSVFCLLTAADGSLWIGMEGSGLLHLKDGRFERLDRTRGLADTFVRALAQDRAGRIWIGTNNGLFRVRTPSNPGQQETVERIDGTDLLPAVAVNSVLEDHKGRLWLGGSELVVLDHGTVQHFVLGGEKALNRVKSLAETPEGTVWVGTVSGLYRMGPGQSRFEAAPGIHGTVRGLRYTRSGELWVAIIGQGTTAYRLNNGANLIKPRLVISDTVLSLFEDAEDNLWAGTGSGTVRFTPTPVSLIALPHANDIDFGTVYLDREGTVWAASTHLYRVRQGVPSEVRLRALHGLKVRNVLEDRDGSLWFGTDGSGLVHIGATGARRYTTKDGLANNYIRALVQSRDGSLWVGTDEGISHIQGPELRSFGMAEGLAYQSVRSMLEDRTGDLWIGTEQGLSHLHDGRFLSDAPVTALRQDKVWALHEDAEGSLWFGTRNDGLYRWRGGKLSHLSTADGLASRGVYAILEDAGGHFWMSGPTGVSLLNRLELDRAADRAPAWTPAGPDAARPAQKVSLTLYSVAGQSDVTQLFGGMQSAGALSPNGDSWFPSNRGPVHIASTVAPPWSPSPLVIRKVTVDGKETSAQTIALEPGNSRLLVDYTPVMMRSQEATRFRYKLEGLESEWNDAGTRHTAEYTNLPPGQYRFRVQAFELSHPAQFREADLPVRKVPSFYRRWWFLTSCVLALAAVVFVFHRLRLAQLRRRFDAVLEERSRVAREMHDTLLQGCTSVSAVLEAVCSMNAEQAERKESLIDSARAQISLTIHEVRQAIWALRHEREAPQDLRALLDAMTTRLGGELKIPIAAETTGVPFPIGSSVSHELLMVAREATYNAANHGSPANIWLHLDFGRETLLLTVRDDGCGFDPVPPQSSDLHFGLLSMEERIRRIGGNFSLASRRNAGTKIVVTVPKRAVLSPLHASAFSR